MRRPVPSRPVVDDCLAVIDAIQLLIDSLDERVHEHATADPPIKVLTRVPGVGPFTGRPLRDAPTGAPA